MIVNENAPAPAKAANSELEKTHVASLDGVRAISVAFVIYAHLSITHAVPEALRAGSLGRGGVTIFFVLSGYLITSKLKNEYSRTNSISLRRFYVQRVARLMPAMLLLILVSSVLAAVASLPLNRTDVIHCLTYTVNYSSPLNNTLLHLWSLSVEEQFYLLWPLVLLAFPRKALPILIAVAILCPLIRVLEWHRSTNITGASWHFETVADALALGCVVALAAEKLKKTKIFSSSIAITTNFAIIIICCGINRHHQMYEPMTYSVEAICGAMIVAGLTSFEASVASSILSWRPLVWIGGLSYSLYLWQEMFCLHTPETPTLAFQQFPLNLILTFATAAISYYLVEAPIRKLGRQLAYRL